jgi:hypothetical protein
MLKKICWGAALMLAVCVTSGLTTLTLEARQAKATPAAESSLMSGLPAGPLSGPVKPPLLTRDQLLTRGNQDDKAEITNLLYTYGFFHDSGNAAGIVGLFTKDGAIQGLWNNNGNTLEGSGCLAFGDQVGRVAVDEYGNTAKPGTTQTTRPFPGHSHNIMTNVTVQVHGDTAVLHAYYTRVLANVEGVEPVAQAPHTSVVSHGGEYVSDLRRTPEGWRFYRHRIIGDRKPQGPPRPCS